MPIKSITLEIPAHLAADWGITAVAPSASYQIKATNQPPKPTEWEQERAELKSLLAAIAKGGR